MMMRLRRLWPDGIIFSSSIVCVDDFALGSGYPVAFALAWVSFCNDSFGWFFGLALGRQWSQFIQDVRLNG